MPTLSLLVYNVRQGIYRLMSPLSLLVYKVSTGDIYVNASIVTALVQGMYSSILRVRFCFCAAKYGPNTEY